MELLGGRDQEAALMHFELPVLIKSEIKRKGDKEDVAGQMQLDQIKQLKTNSFVVLGESPKKRPPRKRWQKERGIGGRRSYIIRCKKCSAHASVPPKYIFKRAHVLPSDLQFCPYCRSVEEIREKMRPKIAPVNSWTTQPLVLDVDELTSGLLKKLNTARANSICKNLDIIGFMKADPLRKEVKENLFADVKWVWVYMFMHVS